LHFGFGFGFGFGSQGNSGGASGTAGTADRSRVSPRTLAVSEVDRPIMLMAEIEIIATRPSRSAYSTADDPA